MADIRVQPIHLSDEDMKNPAKLNQFVRDLVDTLHGMNNEFQQNRPVQPNAPDALSVTAAEGIFDIAITDRNPTPGARYFLEYDANAQFSNPTVIDMGPSRNKRTYLGNLKLFWRAYKQVYGADPSLPVYFGTKANPIMVTGGGAAGPAPQPSQGSGTGTTNTGTSGFGGSGAGGGTGGGGTIGGGGCVEKGTLVEFAPGSFVTEEELPCDDWITLKTDNRSVRMNADTLVAVFVRARDLKPGDLWEVGTEGCMEPLTEVVPDSDPGIKVKRTVKPNGTYLANGGRVHNVKERNVL